MGKKQHPMAARIKRMMQSDQEVGKISAPVPTMIGTALDLFVRDLCKGAVNVASDRGARTLTPSHLKSFVVGANKMDFLRDKFADVQDLAEQEPVTPTKRKRSRPTDAPSSVTADMRDAAGGSTASLPLAQSAATAQPSSASPALAAQQDAAPGAQARAAGQEATPASLAAVGISFGASSNAMPAVKAQPQPVESSPQDTQRESGFAMPSKKVPKTAATTLQPPATEQADKPAAAPSTEEPKAPAAAEQPRDTSLKAVASEGPGNPAPTGSTAGPAKEKLGVGQSLGIAPEEDDYDAD